MTSKALTIKKSDTESFRRMIIISVALHVLMMFWIGWKSHRSSLNHLKLNASAPVNVMWAHTVKSAKKTPKYKLPGPRVQAKPQMKKTRTPAKKVVSAKPKKTKQEIQKEKEEAEAKAREEAMKNALASLSSDVATEPTPRPDNFPSSGEGKDDVTASPTGGIAGMLGGNPIFASYRERIVAVLMNNLIWLQPPPPTATVDIQIDAAGNILNPKLVHSSGNPSFDSATLRAIRKSSPLPSPPSELAQDIVGEWISINFDLNRK